MIRSSGRRLSAIAYPIFGYSMLSTGIPLSLIHISLLESAVLRTVTNNYSQYDLSLIHIFAEDFPYLQIAGEYEAAGAAAISCLTEPYYFQGSDRYLKQIASTAAIPVLKKDFTVDEYMVYQAAAAGAAAILLICAILDDAQLKSYMELARCV